MAQSSVTLYGIVDSGFSYNSNAGGHGLFQQASGNMQSNRWGLKGEEDLGGGFKAVFDLENGFNLSNGAFANGGAEFGKRAFVGLSSRNYGTVTLGRQPDTVIDFVARFAASNNFATGYGSHPGDFDNYNTNTYVNNTIKYMSVDYAGIRFGGSYSFGNHAGNVSQSQVFTGGASYSRGPVAIGVGYVNARDPNFSYYSGNNPSSSTTASNMTNLVNSGYASAHTLQVIDTGASLQLGKAVLAMTYSNVQYLNLGAETGIASRYHGEDAKFNNVEVSARYLITPALQIGAAYDGTFGYGVNDARYHEFSLGLDYALSKRTDLYLVGLHQRASGVDSTGQKARAQIFAMTAADGQHQTGVLIGMRHKF
jgi:predicted porin